MDKKFDDVPGGSPNDPADDAVSDEDARVKDAAITSEEASDELGPGAPSTGTSVGGETVAGSGHVETMGGVLSGGQDYTAVNSGGTGVDRGAEDDAPN